MPRGRLTEFIGSPTSGMTTLALTLLATAQRQGELAAYLDLVGTFDAEYAAACGVDLGALLLVQPATATEALELLAALVASGGIGLLIADQLGELQANPNHAPLLDSALRRLAGPLAASPCALVALSVVPYSPALLRSIGFRGSALAHAAAICIHVARAAWADDPLRLGCVAQVLILKHRLGGDYATVTIALDFAPLLVAS